MAINNSPGDRSQLVISSYMFSKIILHIVNESHNLPLKPAVSRSWKVFLFDKIKLGAILPNLGCRFIKNINSQHTKFTTQHSNLRTGFRDYITTCITEA